MKSLFFFLQVKTNCRTMLCFLWPEVLKYQEARQVPCSSWTCHSIAVSANNKGYTHTHTHTHTHHSVRKNGFTVLLPWLAFSMQLLNAFGELILKFRLEKKSQLMLLWTAGGFLHSFPGGHSSNLWLALSSNISGQPKHDRMTDRPLNGYWQTN
jgi:hypothetical protein